MKISGLTTAALIWAAAAIGVLVGLGFYFCRDGDDDHCRAFCYACLRFDLLLPSRRPVSVTLQFKKGFFPPKDFVKGIINANGYELAKGSLTIQSHHEQVEWRFVAISVDRRRDIAISELAEFFPLVEGVESFHLYPRKKLGFFDGISRKQANLYHGLHNLLNY